MDTDFPRIDRDEQLKRYREEMGDEAAIRQVIDSEQFYACCHGRKAFGHHPDCKSHPAKRAERAHRKYHGDKGTEAAS